MELCVHTYLLATLNGYGSVCSHLLATLNGYESVCSYLLATTGMDLCVHTCWPHSTGMDLCVHTCWPHSTGMDLCIHTCWPQRVWILCVFIPVGHTQRVCILCVFIPVGHNGYGSVCSYLLTTSGMHMCFHTCRLVIQEWIGIEPTVVGGWVKGGVGQKSTDPQR